MDFIYVWGFFLQLTNRHFSQWQFAYSWHHQCCSVLQHANPQVCLFQSKLRKISLVFFSTSCWHHFPMLKQHISPPNSTQFWVNHNPNNVVCDYGVITNFITTHTNCPPWCLRCTLRVAEVHSPCWAGPWGLSISSPVWSRCTASQAPLFVFIRPLLHSCSTGWLRTIIIRWVSAAPIIIMASRKLKHKTREGHKLTAAWPTSWWTAWLYGISDQS